MARKTKEELEEAATRAANATYTAAYQLAGTLDRLWRIVQEARAASAAWIAADRRAARTSLRAFKAARKGGGC